MKVVADTSSLMSLEFMEILDDAFSVIDVYITTVVEEELKEIAELDMCTAGQHEMCWG